MLAPNNESEGLRSRPGSPTSGMPNVAGLPYRKPLLELIRREKALGRPTHLVTAADQKMADAVAAHLGLFDSVTGSDGKMAFNSKRHSSHHCMLD
jgi:hypothetical protein